jgi:hypothetical protein
MSIDNKALGCKPGAPPVHYIAGNYPFCMFDPGFYGRDHGDASGTPPDAPTITAVGIYPAGGRPDNTSLANTSFKGTTQRGQGADGAGITPMYMSFFTTYLKAEIAARKKDEAGAKLLLDQAIDQSIAYVKGFADGLEQPVTVAPWSVDEWERGDGSDFDLFVDKYHSAVDKVWTESANKLHVIGREFWVASYGNGIEAYNSYRRTGGPDFMQPTIQPNPGPWLRSLIYSANYVNLNQSATQKSAENVNKVFWDGNAEDLN